MRSERSIQKSEETLKFIKDYIHEHNLPPSVREIQEGLGISSTSIIHRRLHHLEEDGKIRMTNGKNRSITIIEKQSSEIPLIRPEDCKTITKEKILTYLPYSSPRDYPGSLFAVTAVNPIPEAGILLDDILVISASAVPQEQELNLYLTPEHEISVTPSETGMLLGTLLSLIRHFKSTELKGDSHD